MKVEVLDEDATKGGAECGADADGCGESSLDEVEAAGAKGAVSDDEDGDDTEDGSVAGF